MTAAVPVATKKAQCSAQQWCPPISKVFCIVYCVPLLCGCGSCHGYWLDTMRWWAGLYYCGRWHQENAVYFEFMLW